MLRYQYTTLGQNLKDIYLFIYEINQFTIVISMAYAGFFNGGRGLENKL